MNYPVRLTQRPTCSASFFQPEQCFFLTTILQEQYFLVNSAKIQQVKRGIRMPFFAWFPPGKIGRLALPLHNAGRSLRQSPQNAAVSASVQSTKVGCHHTLQRKDQSLAHVRFSRPQQAFKRYELVSQVPGKTL